MSPYELPDDIDEIVEDMHQPLGDLLDELSTMTIDEQMKEDLITELFHGEAQWK
jgi:hypothetical protein